MKLNIVPASTGMTWVRLGIKTFLQQPLAMSGLFFLYMAAGTLLSFLPVFGLILALMIVPAATLGLMAATQEALKGKFPMPTVLVSAFRAGRQRVRAMLVLGGLYAAACLVITLVVPLLVGATPPPAADAGREAMLTPQFQLTIPARLAAFLARTGAGPLARHFAGQEPLFQPGGLYSQRRGLPDVRPGLVRRVPRHRHCDQPGFRLAGQRRIHGCRRDAAGIAHGGHVFHLDLLHVS
jgi:hypothetical protein